MRLPEFDVGRNTSTNLPTPSVAAGQYGNTRYLDKSLGLRASLTSLFWRSAYNKWVLPIEDRQPGYSILLMLPGDLPLFLDLALSQFQAQDLTHCVEILVIPDRPYPRFRDRFDACVERFPNLPLRFVNLPPLDRCITFRLNNPHHNYFLQLYNGMRSFRGTHAVLHDVDLFFLNSTFLKTHYENCVARNLDVFGVSYAWDEWYRRNGYAHVVSTWEMLLSADWAHKSPPYMHRGHLGAVDGKVHEFDATLLPQCLTPPERVGRQEAESEFVHFNYVFGTYRWFQRSAGRFEDTKLRVLLIRLLIDAYDQSRCQYDIPTIDEICEGLHDSSRRVTYTERKTRENYAEFRAKLARLLEKGRLAQGQVDSIQRGVAAFDRAFDWAGRRPRKRAHRRPVPARGVSCTLGG